MLKIGVDLRPTEAGFKSHAGRGTGRYTAELVASLARIGEAEGVSISPLGSSELLSSPTEQFVYNALPLGRVTFSTQLLLPRAMARQPVDAFHFFHHGDAPALSRLPRVVTVLDLIPLRFPDLYKAGNRNLRFHLARFLENQSIRGAQGLLAISEATKRDLVSILGVPEERVFVTPLAVSKQFAASKTGNKEELRERLGISADRPLLLYVGGIDPRKNVPFLIETFAKLFRESRLKPQLALAGSYESDRHFPKLLSLLERLGLKEEVKILGFVPDEDIASLYQLADITLFPSLYEGFGLPVLESMACGTPVVAGNNSSIPEVAGEGGAVLLPDSQQDIWVREIAQLLRSKEERRRLAERGLKRASCFSWEKTAKLTCEAYKFFVGNPAVPDKKPAWCLKAHAVGEKD